VLHAHDVPNLDRVWLLLNCGMLGISDVLLVAAAAAERALLCAGITDARCWDAVRVTRLAALGEVVEVKLAWVEVEWSAEEAVMAAKEAVRAAAEAKWSPPWCKTSAVAAAGRAARVTGWAPILDDLERLAGAE